MAKTQSMRQQAVAQRQRVFEIAEKLEEAQVNATTVQWLISIGCEQ
jgi:hypothetical protein